MKLRLAVIAFAALAALTLTAQLPKPSGSGGGGSASSSGMVLVQQQTASSSATLDFASCISSTYDEYRFSFINVKPATDLQDLNVRFSTDGGSTYNSSAIYGAANWIWRAGGGAAAGSEGGATSINLTWSDPTNATANWGGVNGEMFLYDPGSANYKWISAKVNFYGESSPKYRLNVSVGGTFESTSAVDAVRFYFTSGNISSGTIRCYGIAK